MKSLAYTVKQVLKEMPFSEDYRVKIHSQLFLNLDQALALYDEAREVALSAMYKHAVFQSVKALDEMADREEIAASMDYFSHSLQEFVCETRELMYVLKELEAYQASQSSRSWTFLKFWRRHHHPNRTSSSENTKGFANNTRSSLTRTYRLLDSVAYRVWRWFRHFKKKEFKFAIKVGVGAALFALPAMVDETRPIFVEWRLEWGLLSFFIILNASVGGTYSAAFWRVLGSALGTGLAIINWLIFPANPFALAPLGAVIAAPCMWMIVSLTSIRHASTHLYADQSYQGQCSVRSLHPSLVQPDCLVCILNLKRCTR